MTRIGDTAADCISGIEARVKRDLDELLGTETTVSFYSSIEEVTPITFEGYIDLAEELI